MDNIITHRESPRLNTLQQSFDIGTVAGREVGTEAGRLVRSQTQQVNRD